MIRNDIIGYFTNSGLCVTNRDNYDYVQIKLLGKNAMDHNAITLVSKESLQKIFGYNWYLSKSGYPIAYGSNQPKSFCKSLKQIRFKNGIKMHHMILDNFGKGFAIDHINRDKLDNRTCNLRICTQKQNSYNTSKPKNSKYNFKGVRQQKSGKWVSCGSNSNKRWKNI